MKSGLKYLLLLSLFIFKGHDHAFAANYVGSLSQTAVHDVQGDKISDCNDQKDPVYWLLDNLLNDDDDDLISIKEKTSLRSYTTIFADTFFLDNLSLFKTNFQFRKTYCHSSPDKYIFQRVIRI